MTIDLLPLEGITVVALEQAVAAPLATRHLADLGAHTDAVLAELGLGAGAIDRLAAGGVVGRPTDVPVPTP